MDTYLYNAVIDSVYDGDTMTCTVNCGFGIQLSNQKLTLYGINAPEIRGNSKEEGKKARDAIKEKVLGKKVVLKTIKDTKCKTGRYYAVVYVEEEGNLVNKN